MSFSPPITALKLCVSIGSNPPYEQDISTASMGSNSVQITDINGLLTAFNSEDVGTSFTPSLIATYNPGSFPSGDTLSIPSVSNFIPRQSTPTLSLANLPNNLATGSTFSLSDYVGTNSTGVLSYSSSVLSVATVNSSTGLVTLVGAGTTNITVSQAASADGLYAAADPVSREIVVRRPISRAANGVTIKYNGPNTLSSEPLFIQANPRGTGMEWFAVVDLDGGYILSYANNEDDGINYFKPPGQASPVIFNNIVTTLMRDMTNTFYNATTFNQNIGSWDISNVISIGQMFGNAGAFNNAGSPDIGKWDTSKVQFMFFTFYNATNFNQDISAWNVGLATPKLQNGFRDGSALITANMPLAFQPSISLATNGVTIRYTGLVPTTEPLFIQANLRGTGMEWFAVVTDNSIGYINSYAKNIQAGIDYFKPPGQANPVIFNNIVTTLVTNMSEMFYNATSFNEDISSWDTSILTYMSFMFYNASAFNQNLSGWNVGNVIERGYFATGSPLALPENSHKLPPFVV